MRRVEGGTQSAPQCELAMHHASCGRRSDIRRQHEASQVAWAAGMVFVIYRTGLTGHRLVNVYVLHSVKHRLATNSLSAPPCKTNTFTLEILINIPRWSRAARVVIAGSIRHRRCSITSVIHLHIQPRLLVKSAIEPSKQHMGYSSTSATHQHIRQSCLVENAIEPSTQSRRCSSTSVMLQCTQPTLPAKSAIEASAQRRHCSSTPAIHQHTQTTRVQKKTSPHSTCDPLSTVTCPVSSISTV